VRKGFYLKGLSESKDGCGIFYRIVWFLHGLFLISSLCGEHGLMCMGEHLLISFWNFGRIEFYLSLSFLCFSIVGEVCSLEIRGLRIRKRLFNDSILSSIRPRYLTVGEDEIGTP